MRSTKRNYKLRRVHFRSVFSSFYYYFFFSQIAPLSHPDTTRRAVTPNVIFHSALQQTKINYTFNYDEKNYSAHVCEFSPYKDRSVRCTIDSRGMIVEMIELCKPVRSLAIHLSTARRHLSRILLPRVSRSCENIRDRISVKFAILETMNSYRQVSPLSDNKILDRI